MKIYTRTGDGGDTGLVGGSRLPKDSARISAIGDLDELNAAIGIAITNAHSSELAHDLRRVQEWLFELGAELATPESSRTKSMQVSDVAEVWLEASIDDQIAELPLLRHFILPGGGALAAQIHFCRCVCRRAERSALALHRSEPLRAEALKFLNRLSDWLFVTARTANKLENVEDVKWEGLQG